MRVVAGALGGRRLEAPKKAGVRPTADRVREAIFSILGPVEGARVLDLYAGSGALGLEALSRGAAEATFVDDDPRAVATVRRNLRMLGVTAGVHRRDALAFLRSAAGPYDLVFCDPPYSCAARLGEPLSRALPPVLSDDALIVTESDKRNALELDLPHLTERVYGDTRIAVHRGS
jgi:16S rRNA (guanine966-N2)-methyltransferase